MRYVNVEVTPSDIEAGVPGGADSCPIARALNRAGFLNVAVGENDWGVGILARDSAKLPESARRFVRRFDAGQPVLPSRFRLQLPESRQ